jgi:hypothetical protein
LVTAFHVGKSLFESGGDWAISLGNTEVVMDSELRSKVIVKKWSVELDVVILEIPLHIFTVLGVKAAKVTKTPLTQSVSARGVKSADLMASYGVVTKATSQFAFRHTISTERGWSGAPIVNASGAVIGMHVRGFGAAPAGHVGVWLPHNVGVSFDWSVISSRGAESDMNLYAFAHRDDYESDDDEDRRITLHEEGADRFMDTRENAYGDWYGEEHDWRGERFDGFRWSDEDVDFDSSPFESAFPLCPPTGAQNLVDTGSIVRNCSVDPKVSFLIPSVPTPVVDSPVAKPQPAPPKKSSRKSRRSKGGAGQQLAGKVSSGPLESTPAGISREVPNTPATPTANPSPQPGSDALSKELRKSLALLVPLAATTSPLVLSQMVSSLPSGEENLKAALSWLSERTQRNAARTSKKSAAISARLSASKART